MKEWRNVAASAISRLTPEAIAEMTPGAKNILFGRMGSSPRRIVEDITSTPSINPTALGGQSLGEILSGSLAAVHPAQAQQ